MRRLLRAGFRYERDASRTRSTQPSALAMTLESQLLQVLFLAALVTVAAAVTAEQLLPEFLVIAARLHRQGHGHAPSEQQHFLFGLETRQHAAQRFPSRETREHSVDIVIVAE